MLFLILMQLNVFRIALKFRRDFSLGGQFYELTQVYPS
jgi:hypothetical protein